MTEHQRETAFLRHLILLDGTDEGRKLEKRIEQAQRDESCIKRAAWLTALITALGAVGYGYGEILQENISHDISWFAIKLLFEVGLVTLIPLLALVSLLMVHRRKLNFLREDCRQLVTRLLESRLGQPHLTPLRTAQFEAAGRNATRRTVEDHGSHAGQSSSPAKTGSRS
jgi:hypothetical protein